jgi:hypothetical protein
MTCTNKVKFLVLRGFDFRKVEVSCGRTDPWGNRTICHNCRLDSDIMASIKRHEDDIKADNEAARSAGWGDF